MPSSSAALKYTDAAEEGGIPFDGLSEQLTVAEGAPDPSVRVSYGTPAAELPGRLTAVQLVERRCFAKLCAWAGMFEAGDLEEEEYLSRVAGLDADATAHAPRLTRSVLRLEEG